VIVPAHAAVFNIPSRDVAALIAAMNTANANGEENINLEPGTFTLTAVDEYPPIGPNGLSSITGKITISGDDAKTTIIERDENASAFRIIHIAESAQVLIKRLTIRGGRLFSAAGAALGAGIRNEGDLIIEKSVVEQNNVVDRPGGDSGAIANSGTLTVTESIISRNSADAGAGIANFNTARVIDSTITSNDAGFVGGGVYSSLGDLIIDNSTIRDNTAFEADGLFNNSNITITIINTTISNNLAIRVAGGGIENRGTLNITYTRSLVTRPG